MAEPKPTKTQSLVKVCSVAECGRKVSARGYCTKHYQRWRNHGDPLGGRPTQQGLSQTRAYVCWGAMLKRCEYPADVSYQWYGGRGISVCEDWHDFLKFYADMGEPPTDKHSLDRINSDGNYEPNNCRWATMQEQQRNRRNNRHIEVRGVTKTLAAWGDVSPVGRTTIHQRLGKKHLCTWCAVFLPPYAGLVCAHGQGEVVDER